VLAVDVAGRVEHVGLDTRRDEVHHLDPGGLELAPQRFAQRYDARLRGGVRARGREGRVAADRRVVDDQPAPALEHARQQPGGQVRDRDEVHLEHRVDVVEWLLLQQPARHQAGVVDQDVDRRQSRDGLLDALAA